MNSTLSLQEIMSQPAVWERTLSHVAEKKAEIELFFHEMRSRRTYMVGCGSSYWGARSTSLILREAGGRPVETVTGGEMYANAPFYYSEGDELLLIVPSRSGHTGEIERALIQAKEHADTKIFSTLVYERSPFEKLSDLTITLPWAAEESVCQTKSFTSLAVAQAAAFRLANGLPLDSLTEIPKAGEKLIANYTGLLQDIAADRSWSDVIAAGQGKAFGIACESALILIEMSETHANYYHTLEVAHGPNVVASSSTLAILYQSDHIFAHEQRVIRDLRQRGTKVLVIGQPETERDYDCDYYIAVPELNGEFERALVGMIVPQLLANFRALCKGVDPDNPHNLVSWIPIAE